MQYALLKEEQKNKEFTYADSLLSPIFGELWWRRQVGSLKRGKNDFWLEFKLKLYRRIFKLLSRSSSVFHGKTHKFLLGQGDNRENILALVILHIITKRNSLEARDSKEQEALGCVVSVAAEGIGERGWVELGSPISILCAMGYGCQLSLLWLLMNTHRPPERGSIWMPAMLRLSWMNWC